MAGNGPQPKNGTFFKRRNLMAIDLNQIAEKLKKQKNIGVTRDGRLINKDPKTEGEQENPHGNTVLEPKRFFFFQR